MIYLILLIELIINIKYLPYLYTMILIDKQYKYPDKQYLIRVTVAYIYLNGIIFSYEER